MRIKAKIEPSERNGETTIWMILLRDVDLTREGAWAFRGPFVLLRQEVEYDVHSLFLEKVRKGRGKRAASVCRLWELQKDGSMSGCFPSDIALDEEMDALRESVGQTWEVHRMWACSQPGEQCDPFGGITDQQLIEEVKRRGILELT